jgi:hypothetical protein
MARLAGFRVDARAIEDGDWVSPGEEYDDLEIRTRGFTDAYYDAQNAKLRRASISVGGDVSKVSNARQREIRIECLIAHCTLDVRNLTGTDGEPVKFEAFCEMLRDPTYGELVVACIRAAALVGRVKEAEIMDAVGN